MSYMLEVIAKLSSEEEAREFLVHTEPSYMNDICSFCQQEISFLDSKKPAVVSVQGYDVSCAWLGGLVTKTQYVHVIS